MKEKTFDAAIMITSVAIVLGTIVGSYVQISSEPVKEVPTSLVVDLPEFNYTKPHIDWVFSKKARDDAQAQTAETMAIYDMAFSIKPVRPFVPYTLKYVGKFYLTMYAATVEQCGNTLGITASGRKCTEDPTCYTVAVDPKII